MNTIHKRNTAYVKKTVAIAATTLVISFPISGTLDAMNLPGFGTHEVSAATLGEINLLQQTNVSASAVEGMENTFDLSLSGKSIANLELIGPERIANFYVDLENIPADVRDGIEIVAQGDGHVRVEILPISLEDLPGVGDLLNTITGTLTGTVDELLDVINRIVNNPLTSNFIEVEGIDELGQAIAALNNLESALSDVLAYDANVPVHIDGNVVSVDFTDGVGNHLEGIVKDLVYETVTNVIDAIDGLKINILPGLPSIPGIPDPRNIINGLLGEVTGLASALAEDVI